MWLLSTEIFKLVKFNSLEEVLQAPWYATFILLWVGCRLNLMYEIARGPRKRDTQSYHTSGAATSRNNHLQTLSDCAVNQEACPRTTTTE